MFFAKKGMDFSKKGMDSSKKQTDSSIKQVNKSPAFAGLFIIHYNKHRRCGILVEDNKHQKIKCRRHDIYHPYRDFIMPFIILLPIYNPYGILQNTEIASLRSQ